MAAVSRMQQGAALHGFVGCVCLRVDAGAKVWPVPVSDSRTTVTSVLSPMVIMVSYQVCAKVHSVDSNKGRAP
jgi:hypothetical protein